MANIPTVSHNEGTPGGSDYIRDGDDRIIEFKKQVRQIIAVDHKMDSSGKGETWGRHKMTTFIQGASPSAVADTNILFSEDVSSVPQIKCKHEAGYEEQITGIGKYDQNVIIHAKSDTAIDTDATQINIQGQVEAALDVTIDTTTTGANAMDTGSLGASATYFIWAIYDTTNSVAAGLLSTSSTAPTMPANYVLKRLIGYAFTDVDSDLLVSYQFMNHFKYDRRRTITTTVSAGAWSAALDCSAAIPTGVRMGIFYLSSYGEQLPIIGIKSADGVGDTNNVFVYASAGNRGVGLGGQITAVDSSQQVKYYNLTGATSTNISVEGFICGLF